MLLAVGLSGPAMLTACASSPLYDIRAVAGGTPDEIPRDGNGEPMLGAVRPIPVSALPVAKPVAP